MRRWIIFSFIVSGLFSNGINPGFADDLQVKVFVVDYAELDSLLSVVRDLKSQQGKVSIDRNTRSLIVVDYPKYVQAISEVIGQLDMPEQQVQIKVLICEVSDSFLSKAGITGSRVVIPEGDWNVVMNLLQADSESKLKSQTMVRTISGHPAKIQASQDVFIGESLVKQKNGIQIVTVHRQPVGEFLEVIPRVNYDRTIEVSVHPAVSDLTGEGVPFTRSAVADVIVKDGDTIVIGGVETSRGEIAKRRAFSFVPFYRERAESSRKTIIFLTVDIVY